MNTLAEYRMQADMKRIFDYQTDVFLVKRGTSSGGS